MRTRILNAIKRRIIPAPPPQSPPRDILDWSGNYTSWQDAQEQCTGYDADIILQRCIAGYQEVKAGRAAFERDSVTFKNPEYDWPLLAIIQSIALKNHGKIRICDWGGSLGSAYFQHKKYLDHCDDLTWTVVEQPTFVNYGKKEIADARILFHSDFHAATQAMGGCDLLMFRSVLPYLSAPHEFLEEVTTWDARNILIQCTTFTPNGHEDRLTVQQVPEYIYPASYPCWFFDKDRFLAHFKKTHTTVAEWTNQVGGINIPSRRLEFHFSKK